LLAAVAAKPRPAILGREGFAAFMAENLPILAHGGEQGAR
jgi:hypothetical protein